MSHTIIFDCPCCRSLDICASERIRAMCAASNCCTTCVETDFRRLRQHIARIRATLYYDAGLPFDGPEGPNGRIAEAVAAGGNRDVLRQLYVKRRRQLAAARQRMIDAGADPDAPIRCRGRAPVRPPSPREIKRHIAWLQQEGGVMLAQAWMNAIEKQYGICVPDALFETVTREGVLV